jgi:hypothetical protein
MHPVSNPLHFREVLKRDERRPQDGHVLSSIAIIASYRHTGLTEREGADKLLTESVQRYAE